MIAEIIAEHIAGEVTDLKAVRAHNGTPHDQYPYCVFETLSMKRIRPLNKSAVCTRKAYEGSIRFYLIAEDKDALNVLSEKLKDSIDDCTATSATHRVVSCGLIDETDITQDASDEGDFYVLSVDYFVQAVKL